MTRIPDIFKNKQRTLSFELFPPKTEKGYANLMKTIQQLAELGPDFMSCTYGAGGGNRDKTFDIVQMIETDYNIPAMAHLTCVLNSKTDIQNILNDMKSRNIENILALRGDPPIDQPDWIPADHNFKYSSELVAFIREQHNHHFGISVAGFPEGHLLCPNRDQDADFLKLKVDAGADFIITQLFFNNCDYFEYVERLRKRGVTHRVIPGILPITDYKALLRFCGLCGASISKEVKTLFEPLQDDKDAVLQAGIEFAVRQSRELLDGGSPGLHFYSLNKIEPLRTILNKLGTDTH